MVMSSVLFMFLQDFIKFQVQCLKKPVIMYLQVLLLYFRKCPSDIEMFTNNDAAMFLSHSCHQQAMINTSLCCSSAMRLCAQECRTRLPSMSCYVPPCSMSLPSPSISLSLLFPRSHRLSALQCLPFHIAQGHCLRSRLHRLYAGFSLLKSTMIC